MCYIVKNQIKYNCYTLTVIANCDNMCGVIIMEILQLKYFCDAAETQNFSETAKKFGVPPSNISQCIKRLESELDTRLFNRRSNSLFLNEQGRLFYEKVSVALKLIYEARADVENTKLSDEIKICIIANRRIVMKAIERFRLQKPDVRFIVSHKYDKSEDFDLIITDELFDSKEMEKTMIISEEISLAIKKDNPLVNKECIEIDDIREENFISLNRESSLFAVTHQFCKSKGFEPNIVIQSDDPFYMRKCVELGLGVAFVPVFSWKGLFSEDVVLKPIEGFNRNTCAFRARSKYLSKSTDEFLDILIQECKREKQKV